MMELLRWKILAEILLFGFLPLVFLLCFPFDFENSDVIIFPYLLVILGRIFWLFRFGEWDSYLLGLKFSWEGFWGYFFVTLLVVFVLYFVRDFLVFPAWLSGGDVWWFLLLHSFLQEIIFRGYFLNRFYDLLRHKFAAAFFSAFLFGAFHLILPDSFMIFWLTFFMGILWGVLFLRFRNLYFLGLSHFVVNFSIGYFF